MKYPKHKSTNRWRTASAALISVLLAHSAFGVEVELFNEGFETDGLGTRYSVDNASNDDDAEDGGNGEGFFARRALGSLGVEQSGGTVGGGFIWAARDIDEEGTAFPELGLEDDEARITWINPIDISSVGDLTVSLSAASIPGELEFDNAFFVQVRVDSSSDDAWETIGGFRGDPSDSNNAAWYFVGDESTVPDVENAPQLSNTFADFEWPVPFIGDDLEIRIQMNANGSDEGYSFDNLTVEGDNAVQRVTITSDQASYAEDAGSGTLTFTAENAAPPGGLSFDIAVDEPGGNVSIPASATINPAETSVDVPFDIFTDGVVDGDAFVTVSISGAAVSQNQSNFIIEDIDDQLGGTEQVVFQESFETDGLLDVPPRYETVNGSDDGGTDFFARREIGSAGLLQSGGDVDGDFVWAIRDIDGEGVETPALGLESDEARLTFTETIDISGLGNLTIQMAAANDPFNVEFDNALQIQVRIDSDDPADWQTIGGFRGTFTNSPAVYFAGDETTLPPQTNRSLTNTFSTFEWGIPGFGDEMELRFEVNANGSTEGYSFDNIRIAGDSAVEQITISSDQETYPEDQTTPGTLTFSTASGDPVSGDLTFDITTDDTETYSQDVSIPASATIPDGSSSVNVPFDIVADNRFDGDQLITVTIDSSEITLNNHTFTVTNVDALPTALLINEILTDPPGSLDTDPVGDVNNDGVRSSEQDEFIEIVNISESSIDLSGWNLTDEIGIRHTFPEDTSLDAGAAIVVFGGGTPSGVFGGAEVQIASQGNLGWSNGGDTASIVAGGAVITSISYDGTIGGSNSAFSRNPDLSGVAGSTETFELVSNILGPNADPYTPGTTLLGAPFGQIDFEITLTVDNQTIPEDGGPTAAEVTVTLDNPAPAGGLDVTISTNDFTDSEIAVPDEPITIAEGDTSGTFFINPLDDGILDGDQNVDVFASADLTLPGILTITVSDIARDPYALVINEALGDVSGTGLDPNQDGNVEQEIEDQFIEIVNNDPTPVNMAGMTLWSFEPGSVQGEVQVHTFPEGTILPADGSIVVFGGVDEAFANDPATTAFGGAIVQEANAFTGVNVQVGDDGVIELRNEFGFVIDSVSYDSTVSDQGMALTREPDITGDFGALHFEASGLTAFSSPGTSLDGTTAFIGNGGDTTFAPEDPVSGLVGDDFSITIQTVNGLRYQLLRAESLVDGFSPVGAVVVGDGTEATLTDPGALSARDNAFYRIETTN